MEINQQSTNKNLTQSEAKPQRAGLTQKLFIAVIISILLSVAITGLAVYFWQKSASEKVINDLEQKISILERKISIINNEKRTSQPTASTESSLSQTANSITSWKTYIDDDLNYSIKYPNEFSFKGKTPSAKYIIIQKPGGEVEGTGVFSHFFIAIEEGPKVNNLEDAVLYFQEQSSGDNVQFTSTKNKDLNEVESLYYYQEGSIGYQQNYVLFNNYQQLIHINVIFANINVQKNEQSEVDQILSTFKLIN